MSADKREINRDYTHLKDHIADVLTSASLAMNMLVALEEREKNRRRETDKEESK